MCTFDDILITTGTRSKTKRNGKEWMKRLTTVENRFQNSAQYVTGAMSKSKQFHSFHFLCFEWITVCGPEEGRKGCMVCGDDKKWSPTGSNWHTYYNNNSPFCRFLCSILVSLDSIFSLVFILSNCMFVTTYVINAHISYNNNVECGNVECKGENIIILLGGYFLLSFPSS